MAEAKLKKFCRTCLASFPHEGFVKLDSLMQKNESKDNGKSDFHDETNKNTTYLDCFLYCTHLKNSNDLPMYICVPCSRALRLINEFIHNARRANELLIAKLDWKRKQVLSNENETTVSTSGGKGTILNRYRCKICHQSLDTRQALKTHIKTHLDIITYKCELCDYSIHKRSILSEHYVNNHKIQPSREQLRSHLDPSHSLKNGLELKGDAFREGSENENGSSKKKTQAYQSAFEAYMSTNEVERQKLEEVERQLAEIEEKLKANKKMKIDEDNNNESYEMPSEHDDCESFISLNADNESTASFFSINESLYEFNPNENEVIINQQETLDNVFIPNEINANTGFIVGPDGTLTNLSEQKFIVQYIDPISGDIVLDNNFVSLENGLLQLNTPLEQSNDVLSTTTVFTTIPNEEPPQAKKPENKMNLKAFFENNDIDLQQTVGTTPPPQADTKVVTSKPIAASSESSNDRKRKLSQTEFGINNKKILSGFYKTTCKICYDLFETQQELKSHMLTHNEISHFFCERCSFYTFYKLDLSEHYKCEHNWQPTHEQLLPKNKSKTVEKTTSSVVKIKPKANYNCDFCLYETRVKSNLRAHYREKHHFEPTDVHLRPTIDHSISNSQTNSISSTATRDTKVARPDNPDRFTCEFCDKMFFFKSEYIHHVKTMHIVPKNDVKSSRVEYLEKSQHQQLQEQQQHQHQQEQQHLQAQQQQHQHQQQQQHMISTEGLEHGGQHNAIDSISNINHMGFIVNNCNAMDVNEANASTALEASLDVLKAAAAAAQIDFPPDAVLQVCVASEGTASIVNNEINDIFLDACTPTTTTATESSSQTGVLTHTMSTDTVPQIVASEQTIENNMVWDFLEDLDVDVQDVVNHENNDRDGLVLTSDEELEEINKSAGGDTSQELSQAQLKQPNINCELCTRRFFTHHQYENHIFLHRGLAPYRCELCTNLYVTKKNLIRHYKAIHKKIPSRDMLQAKGEKSLFASTTQPLIEHLDTESIKANTLMCGKCMYESNDARSLIAHLGIKHGVIDAERFILRKLPYECPRCIRTFKTISQLVRHLERSHLVSAVMQHKNDVELQQQQQQEQQLQEQEQQQLQQQQEGGGELKQEKMVEELENEEKYAIEEFQNIGESENSKNSQTTTIKKPNENSLILNFKNEITSSSSDNNNDINNKDLELITATTTIEAAATGTTTIETSAIRETINSLPTTATTTTTALISNSETRIPELMGSDTKAINILTGDSIINTTPTINAIAAEAAIITTTTTATTTPTVMEETITTSPTNIITTSPSLPIVAANVAVSQDMESVVTTTTSNHNDNNNRDTVNAPQIISSLDAASSLSPSLPTATTTTTTTTTATTIVRAAAITKKGLFKNDYNNDDDNDNDIESKFMCSICNGKYKTELLLKWHMKRHLNRNYVCDQCPKSYAYRNELNKHKLVHSNVLPFGCDLCKKRFGYAHHLKRHRDVFHFGKRRVCPIPSCGREYTSTSQLNLHIFKHKNQVPYRCKYCSSGFKQRHRFRSHVLKMHNIVLTEDEIGEIFRRNIGYTSRHDLTVEMETGEMIRRSDIEASSMGLQSGLEPIVKIETYQEDSENERARNAIQSILSKVDNLHDDDDDNNDDDVEKIKEENLSALM